MVNLQTISGLDNEIKILLLVSFIVGCFVGGITTIGFRNKNITRADFFAVLVSCLWLFSLIAGINISFWFDIMGAMSTTHLIGEKSAKTFLDFLIKYKLGVKGDTNK